MKTYHVCITSGSQNLNSKPMPFSDAKKMAKLIEKNFEANIVAIIKVKEGSKIVEII